MNAQAIPWSGLVGAASLLLLNGLLSVWLGLGLGRKLVIASIRTVVQLLALGFILVPVFEARNPWLVLVWACAMVALAGFEASRRSSRTYRGLSGHAVSALFLGASVNVFLGVSVFIGVEPWWEPRYLIPILGMVLGNALTGVALGLDRCLSVLDEASGRIEAMLSLGATRWEAAEPVAREALRTGMVPILNSMSVAGIVTIPGMMTGQLLSGASPAIAARYQILIMFLIAATIALSTTLAVFLALRTILNREHQLERGRLRVR